MGALRGDAPPREAHWHSARSPKALLQKQYGMTKSNGKMIRVVPLFETLTDLTNAPEVAKTLFTTPAYMTLCDKRQEIMVGYSDSAKDAGRCASSRLARRPQR